MMGPMEAYALPARPLPSGTDVAPIVDLRGAAVAGPDAAGLSPWQWSIDYARSCVAEATGQPPELLTDEAIKAFDSTSGTDQRQLARVLEALDDGRAVAFYGWWPTSDLAAVSDILGVDAMDVPPPDRKRSGLADGHAVVALGYGRHAAFPGGGYLIVRNPWTGADWGDGGDGYLPFTFVRAYAIALRTFRLAGDGASRDVAPTGDSPASDPINRLIAKRARCADPRSTYTGLFFSEDPHDVVRAKAICAKCMVRQLCLASALDRAEPYGVWGGEFLYEGSIVGHKRGRGRPPKTPLPTQVDEVTGLPIVA